MPGNAGQAATRSGLLPALLALLRSVSLAVLVLLLIAVASVTATFIPQGAKRRRTLSATWVW